MLFLQDKLHDVSKFVRMAFHLFFSVGVLSLIVGCTVAL